MYRINRNLGVEPQRDWVMYELKLQRSRSGEPVEPGGKPLGNAGAP